MEASGAITLPSRDACIEQRAQKPSATLNWTAPTYFFGMGKKKRHRSLGPGQIADLQMVIEGQLNELVNDAAVAGWSKSETLAAVVEIALSLSRENSEDGDLSEVLAAVDRMRS